MADDYPQDWRYYTLTFRVAACKQLSQAQAVREMECCDGRFYSAWRIARRVGGAAWCGRHPLISLIGNLSYRSSLRSNHRAYGEFARRSGRS